MNAKEEMMKPFLSRMNPFENFAEIVLGNKSELLYSFNTWQYSDYNKYEHSAFSVEEKTKQKAEQFPLDCESAYHLGMRLAKKTQFGGI
jgi:hypothetical protein